MTSRGNRREATFVADEDRQRFLVILAQTLDRFQAKVVAYCLMGNHYHLVLHTQQPNLSALMRRFNDMVTQSYNRRHGTARAGHPQPHQTSYNGSIPIHALIKALCQT